MTTRRIITMAAIGAMAAASTIAIGATTWFGANAADAGAVHLHLGTDAQRFTYGSTVQNITVGKNSCAINNPASQQLINLASSATGGKSAPGLANYGLGVKESPSSGNGNPCAQIAASEALTITPGSLLAGRMFREVRLDLEMTGDALVSVTLTGGANARTYQLQTGHSITPDQTFPAEQDYDQTAPYVVSSIGTEVLDACAAPNSSGPNSGGNDNCAWTITPGFDFDTIRVSSSIGTATIEGGGDFADNDHDTLFVIGGAAPIANDDSAEVDGNDATTSPKNYVDVDVLGNDTDADGDTLSVAGIATQPGNGTAAIVNNQIRYTPNDGFVGIDTFQYRATDGIFDSNAATVSVRVCSGDEQVIRDDGDNIVATFNRLTDVTVCKINTVDFRSTDTSVLFQPQGDPNETADYRGVITFGPKTPVFDANGALVLSLRYDRDGDAPGFGFEPVPLCINPVFTDGLVTDATIPGFGTPDGDTWCIATQTSTPGDVNVLLTTWQVFGRDDPRFV